MRKVREEKRREEKKQEDQGRERVRRKKIQDRKKVDKSRNAVLYPKICGFTGSKSRLAKLARAESSGQFIANKSNAVLARIT